MDRPEISDEDLSRLDEEGLEAVADAAVQALLRAQKSAREAGGDPQVPA